MNTITVQPSHSRNEMVYVLLTTLLVIIVAGATIALRLRTTNEVSLQSFQINAFEVLKTDEQGIFNDLYAAAMEIIDYHEMEDEKWISVNQLEEDFIPPFVHDVAWSKRGKPKWNMKVLDSETRHTVMYLGQTDNVSDSGSFLLVCLHEHKKKVVQTGAVHAPFEIWHNPDKEVTLPDRFSDQVLISEGWKEVVAYKGEDELKRLKGEEYLQNER